jgi:small subunit ribosomal protein S6
MNQQVRHFDIVKFFVIMNRTFSTGGIMSRKYEGCILLDPGLNEEILAGELLEIEKIVQSAGVTIVHKDLWSKRNLAYPIKKKTEGYYWIIYFEGEPQSIKKITDALKTRETVLRFLFLARNRFPEFEVADART